MTRPRKEGLPWPRTSNPSMYKTILVTLDGSDHAERAIPHAVSLARGLGAEVLFLQVGEELDMPQLADRRIQILEGLEEYMNGRVQDARTQGVAARSLLVEGDPAHEILETAQREGAGMIVMSSHGRSGLGRWLLGSVAEKVMRHAHVPVLVVRPEPA